MVTFAETADLPFRFQLVRSKGQALDLTVEIRLTTVAAWARYQAYARGRRFVPDWGAQDLDGGRVVAVRVRSSLPGSRVYHRDHVAPERSEEVRKFRSRLLDFLEGAAQGLAVELSGGGGCVARFDTPSGKAVRLTYGPDLDV